MLDDGRDCTAPSTCEALVSTFEDEAHWSSLDRNPEDARKVLATLLEPP